MQRPPYGPPDAMVYPRYSGLRTFMRLPHTTDLHGVDFAVVGVPFDTGGTYRVGARFGPEGIRSASVMLRPYHPAQQVAVFPTLSGIDYGDLPTVPGYLPQSHQAISEAATPLFEGGNVTPIFLGGDHSVSLPILRAAAAKHGPLALLHFDSHSDLWDSYYGGLDTHGTPFRRAYEEGLIDPEHSIQVGLRGPVFDESDRTLPQSLGFAVISGPELHRRGMDDALREIRARLGDRPVYLSFDIDFVDPAYAPGTGTPETDGFSGPQCHQLLRGLGGIPFVAYDLVEVMPGYDPAGSTALLAANLVYEFIALIALQKSGARETSAEAAAALPHDLPQGMERGQIGLAIGHPAPPLLPAREMHDATMTLADDMLEEAAAAESALQYGPEQGSRALLEQLRPQIERWEGITIPPEQMMIIGGATQGVILAGTLFADTESGVFVESPSYKDALHIFRDLGRPLHPIPMTAEGIDADALAAECERLQGEGRLPGLLYTVPTYQNPSGFTAPTERREAVLALSRRYGFRIVEDEVYRELTYDDVEVPPSYYELAQRAPDGLSRAEGAAVIRLGSFSKTLAPGLRLGWLLGSAADVEQCLSCGFWEMAGGANPFVAQVVARLLARDAWSPHIARLKAAYRAQRDAMLAALAEHLPAGARWSRPGGGFFIWVELPPGVGAVGLQEAARANGVIFSPGANFFAAPPPQDAPVTLRLSFSHASLAEIQRGIAALGRAVAEAS